MTKKRATKPKLQPTPENIKQATKDLEINQPIRLVRVVGNRLELHLPYSVVKWPETAAERKRRLGAPASRERLAARPKPPPPPAPLDSEDQAREDA
jgi:hypothetical protein